MRGLAWLLLALLTAPAAAAPPAPAAATAPAGGRAPDTILSGRITRADHQTYLSAPFQFPKGADRLLLQVSLDEQEQRTVIDIGLEDPNGIRGASGSNKRVVLVGETAATPSYIAGPMPAGQWKLLIAVPNIREGVTANWQAKLWFLKPGEPDIAPPTAGRGPGWYRGDLHLHTGHSDGSCVPHAQSRRDAAKVPCPLFRTLQTAAVRGLDFVSVTEHNSISHHNGLLEAQPYFDKLLLIPGREITTFFGHFNIHGVTKQLDFRIQPGGYVTFNSIADEVHRLGGIVVVNHPALPSGEACMGCGWTMPDVDPARVDAIETVNGSAINAIGGDPTGPVDGTPFWLDWLGKHGPVGALGSSDNHDGPLDREAFGDVGRPATVVQAEDLTQRGVLAGIRAGRMFIDLGAGPGNLVDFCVHAAKAQACMGGKLAASTGEVRVETKLRLGRGGELLLLDGTRTVARQTVRISEPLTVSTDRPTDPIKMARWVGQLADPEQSPTIAITLAPGRHILRLAVYEGNRLTLLSNAVLVDVE
ncbi:CehA/McbA family metallohydrolase [Sandaracinobacteroides hominis]|uniref:CehA/McbA family metallohydrolase n=1 Tax=Sandaracinobacteroides hominis TaxID=2780086 RepID=UPI0018F499A8|nr:CehA/McbA family metallohydrolase [Sandaracinobacteroides hominis]